MPSQQYRGYVIDVTTFPLDPTTLSRFSYRCSVHAPGGTMHHSEGPPVGCYGSHHAAQDGAFREAREWIERFPLPWPFTVPAEAAP